MPDQPPSGRAPWEPLYDAVALGMGAYTRCAFRVETLGPFPLARHLLVVSVHRAETDVPLLCPSVYRRGRYLFDRGAPRLWFAARDDMFQPGFFAGFPPALPLQARRALWPLGVGRFLPRVRVCPVPYPSTGLVRLGRALADVGADEPLDGLLPAAALDPFAARAASLGLRPPATAGEALDGVYADLLWRYADRTELGSAAFAETWRRRAAEGAAALRGLVELIRSGAMVLLFPEGRPSRDGSLGPLQPGLELLVRRGRPAALLPLGIAYDPLTTGRTRAFVVGGEQTPVPGGDVDAAVLDALRCAMPLTCGQVVAETLVVAAREKRGSLSLAALAGTLDAGVEDARAQGRTVERSLAGDVRVRRERLSEALRWVLRRGLAARSGRDSLTLVGAAILDDPTLAFTAREGASARGRPDPLRLP